MNLVTSRKNYNLFKHLCLASYSIVSLMLWHVILEKIKINRNIRAILSRVKKIKNPSQFYNFTNGSEYFL